MISGFHGSRPPFRVYVGVALTRVVDAVQRPSQHFFQKTNICNVPSHLPATSAGPPLGSFRSVHSFFPLRAGVIELPKRIQLEVHQPDKPNPLLGVLGDVAFPLLVIAGLLFLRSRAPGGGGIPGEPKLREMG